jgi:hypothetical protein
MKSFSGLVRPARGEATQCVVSGLVLVLGISLFVAGCGKKETPPPVNAAAPVVSSNQPPPPQIRTEAPAGAEAGMAVIQQLNRAMVRYRMQHQSNPGSVEELASAAGIKLPPPPEGKKYAINNKGFVVVVDNSAK